MIKKAIDTDAIQNSLLSSAALSAPLAGGYLAANGIAGHLDRKSKELLQKLEHWKDRFGSSDVLKKDNITFSAQGRPSAGIKDNSVEAGEVKFRKRPGRKAKGAPEYYSNKKGYKVYSSGLSGLDTLHSAAATDAAAEAYAKGANELLNTRLFGVKGNTLFQAGIILNSLAEGGIRPSSVGGWGNFMRRIGHSVAHPADAMTERGLLLKPKHRKEYLKDKDHYNRYANTDVNTKAGLSDLATHQYMDLGQFEKADFLQYKGGKEVYDILNDRSMSYVDKENKIKELLSITRKRKNGEVLKNKAGEPIFKYNRNTAPFMIADAIMHGYNPTEKSRKLWTSAHWPGMHDWLASDNVDVEPKKPGRDPFGIVDSVRRITAGEKPRHKYVGIVRPTGGADAFFGGFGLHGVVQVPAAAGLLSKGSEKLKNVAGKLGKWALPAAGIGAALPPMYSAFMGKSGLGGIDGNGS